MTIRAGIKRGALVCAALVAMSLAACGNEPPPVAQVAPTVVAPPAVVAAPPVAVQPAPVVVQQAPAHDGLLTGLLMGHLLSSGGGGTTRNTTVINKSVTNVTRVAPTPRPSYTAPSRPSYSYSRSSSSSFGSFRSGRR